MNDAPPPPTPADPSQPSGAPGSPPPPPIPAPPTSRIGGRRGRFLRDPGSPSAATMAWTVIIGLVAFVVIRTALAAYATAPVSPENAESEIAQVEGPGGVLLMQARYAVGSARFAGGGSVGGVTAKLMESLDDVAATPADRLRVAMVAGELGGAEEALSRLEDLSAELADEETAPVYAAPLLEDVAGLRVVYGGEGELEASAREALTERHSWFAELALTFGADDADPARAAALAPAVRTAVALLVFGVVLIGAGLAGLALFVTALVKLITGSLRLAYAPPAPGGSVYVETFALFLALFLVVGIAAQLVEGATGSDVQAYAIWLLPLCALWPLYRGAPVAAWRHAIGWNKGKGVAREMAAGVIGYLAGLPVLAVGIGFMLALMWTVQALQSGEEAGGGGPPAHPIVNDAVGAGGLQIAQLYLLVAVWAPITEETVFRGALFHHLRGRLGAVAAGLLTGLIFAAIHPQGWLAIAPLAALGFNFAMIREWRGSIIASMTAHALNNSVVITLLVLATG